jgi:hypothetical protein
MGGGGEGVLQLMRGRRMERNHGSLEKRGLRPASRYPRLAARTLDEGTWFISPPPRCLRPRAACYRVTLQHATEFENYPSKQLGTCVCLLLQDLLQSCARGGRRIVEDMC